jgi:hypothetical protein
VPREAAFFAVLLELDLELALAAFLEVPAERLALALAVFLLPAAAFLGERELPRLDADALFAPADFFALDPALALPAADLVRDLPPPDLLLRRRPSSAASAVSPLTSLLKLLFWPPAVSSW